MDRIITEILEDLHRIDPAFDVNDTKLRTMVTDFVSFKPDTHFDTDFFAKLRSELVGQPAPVVSPLSPYVSRFSLFNTRMFTGIAGALVAIFLVAPLTYVVTKETLNQDTDIALKNISTGLSLKQQINTKNNNAFGKLAYINPQPTQNASSANDTETTRSTKDTSIQSTMGITATAPTSKSTPIVYSGAELKLTETEGKVYKRVKGIDAGKELANFLKNANFDVVNVGAFSKLSLETIQLSEDMSFGQTLSINFNEGTISITPYASQWVSLSEKKKQSAPEQLTPEALIEIANLYVSDHGIDVQGYGKPVVSSATVVTYPLLIDGLEIYEEGGSVYGLQIVVDLNEKRVASVNNLTSQIYESSLYALETNATKILKAATGSTTTSEQSEKKIELQTPRRILLRYVIADSSTELYVPALLFVAQGKTDSNNTIVIPLVKDALDKISVAPAREVSPEKPLIENSTTTSILPLEISKELIKEI